MPSLRRLVWVFPLLVSVVPAPPVTLFDLPERPRLEADPEEPGVFRLGWFGRAGFSYFVQTTTDLAGEPWEYLPVIETGADEELGYGVTVDLEAVPRFFARVVLTEQTADDPMNADFDGDGMSNGWEFVYQTDPLSADTDHDGLPDAWEIHHGFPAREASDAQADTDGDGISDLRKV